MSKTPLGPHLERAELGMVLDVPMQDGATYARGVVVEAGLFRFKVKLETLFPGSVVTYDQGALGVVLVADG